MKKYSTLLLLLSLALSATFNTASAEERTMQDITSIAKKLIGRAAVTRSIANGKATPEIKKLTATKAYTVMGYEDGGFAIIANDDANSPIVGYSTDNTFTTDNPAFAWYLSNAEIMLNNHIKPAPRPAGGGTAGVPSDCKKKVDHMVKAKWDQGTPYNAKCPVSTKGGRCLTGCVATAMAQIIHYHRYPAKGVGTNYTWFEGKKLVLDFSKHTYDYDNMLVPNYGDGYTIANKSAISTLMYDCGIAADMQYSVDASGAYLKDAAEGLRDNFDYYAKWYGYKDYPTSDNYDDAKWREVIYRELSAGNPVLYAGGSYTNSTEGAFHCFVLDGYDERGYVGVNWGWSGYSDGYFSLDVMNCKSGDKIENFCKSNDMVIMHPKTQGPITYDLLSKEEIAAGIEDINTENANEAAPQRYYDAAGRQIGTGKNINRNHKGLVIVRQGNKVRKVIR